MFSIGIASWNNLPYLKNCVNSIRKNSHFDHEIIIHLNEAKDGSKEWLESEDIDYTLSEDNVGCCCGVNAALSNATQDYVCTCGDDTYLLPNWDLNILKFLEEQKLDWKTWVSGTPIEPRFSDTHVTIHKDYGRDINSFDETGLLNGYKDLVGTHPHMSYISGTPLVLTRKMWNKVGGYNQRFLMGVGAEDGLSKAYWDAGCRNFVMVNTSLVYHFISKSMGRLPATSAYAQHRDKIFPEIHGVSCDEFRDSWVKWKTPWERKDNLNSEDK